MGKKAWFIPILVSILISGICVVYLDTLGFLVIITVILVATIFFILNIKYTILIFLSLSFSISYLEHIPVGGFSLLDFAGVVVPFLLLVRIIIMYRFIPVGKVIFLYLAFLLYLLIPLFVGIYSTGYLIPVTYWLKFFNGFIALLVGISAIKIAKIEPQMIAKAIILGISVPLSIGLWQFLTGQISTIEFGLPQVNAGFHHEGEIAYDLVFCFPMSLYIFSVSYRRGKKYLWGIIAGLLGLFTLFTFRRNVWLGFLSIIISFLIIKKRYVSVALLGIVIVLMFHLMPFNVKDYMKGLWYFGRIFKGENIYYLDKFFSGRLIIYYSSLKEYLDFPFFNKLVGRGIGYNMLFAHRIGLTASGHNNYLILLTDTGGVGLLLYIALFISSFGASLKILRKNRESREIFNWVSIYICILIAYLVMGFGTHLFLRLVTGEWIFWFLTGVALSFNRNLRNIYSKKKEI